jgi:Gluconate 2-dehydrogenase subunit 3
VSDHRAEDLLATNEGMTRRELLQVAAAAVIAAPVLTSVRAALPHRFFSDAEFQLVDELAELIIPADEHSPGARAAKVADYIDARLGESTETDWQSTWRGGLKLVDNLSQEMHGKSFLEATAEQRVATLTGLAANEKNPKTSADNFFKELKLRVVRGYYSSSIGIHQDQEYKGNVMQPGEFAGQG